MKRQAYQHPELRDANDNIIQQGTYGKASPLVNGDNTGVLDYINNNLEALHDNINGSRIYVANKAALPATGDLSAMYIAEDTGKWYLWDGSKYIETDNARKIADEAIAARDAAKASQTAAKTSETNAKTSEDNAANSKTAAETSASDAASSASDATTQANTAKAWATATTSPDGAADTDSTTGKTQSARSWAMYSKDRATASATSASASETSASAAKTSEDNAASSKTAAETSANSAAASANAAATSAQAAANSAREQQADWNETDSTSKAFIKNKPVYGTREYTVNLQDLSQDNFYPIVFNPDDVMLRCEIHSPDVDHTAEYNQNVLSFRLLKKGWNDTPYSFFVETYNVFDKDEIAIGCVGYGHKQGNVVVWLRGGLTYYILSNRRPIIYPTGFSQEGEEFTFGPNYYGSDANKNTSICFTPQKSVKGGPWYDGLFSGLFEKAICDTDGNTIKGTYAKKSDLASSVSTTSLTVSGETSVPTANAGNSSKAIANTEFVAKSISALVNGAPDQLNTLNELAKALGNNANFAATMTAELAKKLNSAEAESTYATKREAGVPYQIKRNTAYKVGDVLTSPSLPPGCVIVVTQAGTTGSTEPDWATIKSNMGGVISDGTVTFYINDTLSKHSIGDIVYKPATKTGEHEYLLPLDGQTIDGDKYKRLVDYLGMATLPNLNGRYLRADSTPGQMVEAGLPNITGTVGVNKLWSKGYSDGCFTHHTTSGNFVDGKSWQNYTDSISFNASRSNAIYGKSTTVTPLTYTVRAYICYA